MPIVPIVQQPYQFPPPPSVALPPVCKTGAHTQNIFGFPMQNESKQRRNFPCSTHFTRTLYVQAYLYDTYIVAHAIWSESGSEHSYTDMYKAKLQHKNCLQTDPIPNHRLKKFHLISVQL